MVKSQPILRYILRVAPAIAVAVLLSACSSTSTARICILRRMLWVVAIYHHCKPLRMNLKRWSVTWT